MGLFGKRKPVFDPPSKLSGVHSFHLKGKTISCLHCGHNEFEPGTALLNTPGMTFFSLDWANRTATILICTQCSRIEWYMRQPETIG